MCIKIFAVAFVTFLIDFNMRGAGGTKIKQNMVKLNDGTSMPQIGFTAGVVPGQDSTIIEDTGATPTMQSNVTIEKVVTWAIDAGYRYIDTAYVYFAEFQVSRAINKKIEDGTIKRQDVFITTMLPSHLHPRESVVPGILKALDNLQMHYVDLYLFHWHAGQQVSNVENTPYLDTWLGMIDAMTLGLTRSIGVANFDVPMLEKIVTESSVTPASLQVELNLNLQQPKLLHFCRQHNISVSAIMPLGSLLPESAAPFAPPPRIDDKALVDIAKRYNKNVLQITLRYLVELGVIPIVNTWSKDGMEQFIDIFDFQLSKQDKDQLKSYDVGYSTINPSQWKESPDYHTVNNTR